MIIRTRYLLSLLTLLILPPLLAGCGTTSPNGTGDAPASQRALPSSAEPAPAPAAPPTLPSGPGGAAPVFFHGPRTTEADGTKKVALTFDADMTKDQRDRAAGGENFDNPELISLLREEGIASTIFMTGVWASTYPQQAASISDDPLFEVANHSYGHYAYTRECYGLPRLEPAEFQEEAERGTQEIEAAGVTGLAPYFRFPGGCYDEEALRAIGRTGATAIQWDVSSGDAFATDPDEVAADVLAGVRPGSVVVLHCTRSAAPVTTEALRRIIPALRAQGYEFVQVSELIGAALG